MPKVRISAVRFSSLLTNRNLTPADVAQRAKTIVSPDALAAADDDVEFDDLLTLAKLFKRPWSYLLIDEAEQYPARAATIERSLARSGSDIAGQLRRAAEYAEQLGPDTHLAAVVVTDGLQAVASKRTVIRTVEDARAYADSVPLPELSGELCWVEPSSSAWGHLARRRRKRTAMRA